MARKLKIFLAVFFAAITFFVGKVILDKTLAADPDYGTATITYNSGVDGQFEGGATTNTVTYNLTKKMIKYSHTPNVANDGTQLSSFGDDLDYTEIVTIPGAASIHVKVIYGGGDRDNLRVISGQWPNLSKNNDYNTNAPYETISGYNHTMPGAVREFDFDGDSVTFLMYTYTQEHNDGYGYYAVISGETDQGSLALGDIASGEYKEPIGNNDLAFTSWDQELVGLNSNTTVTANYGNKIANSYFNGVDWKLLANGELVIGTENQTSYFSNPSSINFYSYSWYNYVKNIIKVRFVGNVIGSGSMANMFYECSVLKDFDSTNFNTTNVTDMNSMFYQCYKLTTIDLSNFDTRNVTNMSEMFDMGYFSHTKTLTSLDLSNFDTRNVTNMSEMFFNCSALISLNLSSFNTSNVTNMYGMFDSCTNLVNLDISSFNTSNVTDMWGMFGECSSLTSLDLSNFNTANVTRMDSMFGGCESLVNLDLSSFDTSNVTEMQNMFENCLSIETLDISSFDTRTAVNMRNAYSGCSSLNKIILGIKTRIYDLSGLDGSWEKEGSNPIIVLTQREFGDIDSGPDLAGTYNKTNKRFVTIYDNGIMEFSGTSIPDRLDTIVASYIFLEATNYSNENDIPWKNSKGLVKEVVFLDKISPISTAYWFSDMDKLTKLTTTVQEDITTVNLLDTSHIINMEGMFSGCENLRKLDLSWFDTINVTNMKSMFANCLNLQTIEFYSCEYFDPFTAFPKTVEKPKARLLSDDEIEIHGFATSNVTDMSYMFYNCKSLTNIYLNEEIASGPSGPVVSGFNFSEYKVQFLGNEVKNINNECTSNATMFDTSNVTTMEKMFAGCEKLMVLDIGGFDTSNTINTTDMFLNTVKLKKLTLGENFSFVTPTGLTKSWNLDGSNTVYTAAQLEENYDGSTMAGTYLSSDNSYAILYDSGEMVFQYGNTPDSTIGNVVDIYTGFEFEEYGFMQGYDELNDETYYYPGTPWNEQLENITKVSFKDEITPTSTALWFVGMSNLSEIEDIQLLNTSSVISMSNMFNGCSSLTNLDLSGFDTSNVKNMDYMFSGCSGISNLDLSNFNTGKVISLNDMFADCTNLLSVDLSSFDTQNITTMDEMFINCESLISLDLSNFDTSKVTTFVYMFYNCMNLLALDLSSFDVFDSGDTSEMLKNTSNLRVLALGEGMKLYYSDANHNSGLANSWQRDGDDTVYRAETLMSNYDGSTMAGIYRKTTPPIPYVMIYSNGDMVFQLGNDVDSSRGSLLDSFTGFESDTYDYNSIPWVDYRDNITKVEFLDEIYPISTAYWFSAMRNLTTVDNMEYLNTANVTTMKAMFYGCYKLDNLDVSSLNTKKVTNMNIMFSECKKLLFLDLSMFDTSNVVNMEAMFSGCDKLITIDLSSFDTSNVKDMRNMFAYCYDLVNLDLSSFDTSSITSFVEPYDHLGTDGMFKQTYDLSILTLGEDFDFLGPTGLSKSWIRDGDDTIYSASELESNYSGSTMAGTYRAMIKLTISEEVRGSLADVNKNFNFTFNLFDSGWDNVVDTFAYTGSKSGNFNFVDGVATFTLKHGESINTFIPFGYYYEITQNSDGYTLAMSGNEGGLIEDVEVEFIDTLSGTTPTGIYLDMIPYILMIIFGVGSVLLLRKLKYI